MLMILLIWFNRTDVRIYSVVEVDTTGNKSIEHDEHIQAETKWPKSYLPGGRYCGLLNILFHDV